MPALFLQCNVSGFKYFSVFFYLKSAEIAQKPGSLRYILYKCNLAEDMRGKPAL